MIRLQDEIKGGKLQLLLDHNSIQNRIRGLAKEIIHFYEWERNCQLVLIAVMDGAGMFLYDLIKLLPFKIKLYCIKINTYKNQSKIKNSIVEINELTDIENNNILIIDTVLDSGETLNSVIKSVETMKPKTLKTAILLCKNRKREFDIKPDFCGFNIADKWIIGYGMDIDGFYRNLKDIYEVK